MIVLHDNDDAAFAFESQEGYCVSYTWSAGQPTYVHTIDELGYNFYDGDNGLWRLCGIVPKILW